MSCPRTAGRRSTSGCRGSTTAVGGPSRGASRQCPCRWSRWPRQPQKVFYSKFETKKSERFLYGRHHNEALPGVRLASAAAHASLCASVVCMRRVDAPVASAVSLARGGDLPRRRLLAPNVSAEQSCGLLRDAVRTHHCPERHLRHGVESIGEINVDSIHQLSLS